MTGALHCRYDRGSVGRSVGRGQLLVAKNGFWSLYLAGNDDEDVGLELDPARGAATASADPEAVDDVPQITKNHAHKDRLTRTQRAGPLRMRLGAVDSTSTSTNISKDNGETTTLKPKVVDRSYTFD